MTSAALAQWCATFAVTSTRRLRRSGSALGRSAPRLLVHIAVTSVCLLYLMPLAWMVASSLQSTPDIHRLPARWLPSEGFQWSNYPQAWQRMAFGRSLVNSTLVTGLVVLGQLVSATVVGFVVARRRTRSTRFVLAVFLASYIVPYQLTWIPSFFILHRLGMIDSYSALVIPFIAGAFGTLLMFTHFQAVPREFEEAAAIDGCSAIQTLAHVLLPLVLPGLRVVAAITFLFAWSDLIWPLLMTHSAAMRTLPVGLTSFQDEIATDWPQLMAASTMTALPVLLVVVILMATYGRRPDMRPRTPTTASGTGGRP